MSTFCNVCRVDSRIPAALKLSKEGNGMGLVILSEELEGDGHFACRSLLEEAMGDMLVDSDGELAIAREKGAVEPDLYPGEMIKLKDEVDTEKVLNQLLDIQERLSKGLKLIDESNKVIESFFGTHRWMGTLFNCWRGRDKQGNPVPEVTRKRFLKDSRNTVYLKWFDHRAGLWTHWNKLKAEGDRLVEKLPNPALFWGRDFFGLKDMSFDPYWVTSDSAKIDRQEDLYDKLGADKSNQETHLFEMMKDEDAGHLNRYEEMSYRFFNNKRLVRDDTHPLD